MNVLCKVSLCDRRETRRYKNQEKPWAWLKDRCRVPVRTTETASEYPKPIGKQACPKGQLVLENRFNDQIY